jgi:hypothetical protein
MKKNDILICKENLIMENQPLKVFTKNKLYKIIDKSFGGFVLVNDEDQEHTIPKSSKWYNEFELYSKGEV